MSTADLIEIEAIGENCKITVTGKQVIDLLSFLRERSIVATRQDPPTFGFDDFPTIYYIHFAYTREQILESVKDYLKSKSLNLTEVTLPNGDFKIALPESAVNN